jgi:peptide/nickel transport system substrate-binding protein
MIAKAIKLRFRRHLRLQKRQVEELGLQAEQQLERNFFKRLERLIDVRRFVSSWLLLLVLLGGCVVVQMRALGAYYQDISPASGGTYTEGVLGPFTNANPIYANGLADTTVSKLLFAGLLKYDSNNNLIGDLAEGWSVDERETSYLVKLRPGLKWQDGKPLTSADVVFTYHAIQNPDARSSLESSWRGIQVSAPDPLTVKFILPGALSAFPQSLTNGIIPQHVLKDYSMPALRTAPFNSSQPVGSGPFQLKALEVSGSSDAREERIALAPFPDYYGGKPKLDSFVVRTFRSQDRMVASYKEQELTAMVGLTRLPSELEGDKHVQTYSLPLTAQVMTFFKTSEGLLADKAVRHALVRATDTQAIMKSLGYPTRPVVEPFLMGQLGYNPAYAQSAFDLADAQVQLQKAGWVPGKDGIRYKNGQQLTFSLVAQDGAEYSSVAKMLVRQWRAAGVNAELILRDSDEFQAALAGYSYDALLYGISIGRDPDVFVYWDSTQADSRAANRLNFSAYKSGVADVALEAGRTRSDQALRVIKYEPFLKAWQGDAPAVGLYQPRFLYVTRGPVYGLEERTINADIERFKNVENWMIRTVRVSQE